MDIYTGAKNNIFSKILHGYIYWGIYLDLHIGGIRIWTKPSRKKSKIFFRCQNRRYSQFLHFSHKIHINTFTTKKIQSDSSQ